MLFANLSRYIAILEEGQEQQSHVGALFDQFKEQFAQQLAESD